MIFSFLIQSSQYRQIKHAELILKVFKKYIDSSYYSLAASIHENKFFWSYYFLKENYQKLSSWASYGQDISPNEKAINTLIEYYLKHSNEMECPFIRKEWNMFNKLLAGFNERMHITSKVPSQETGNYPPYIGSVGIES